MTPIAVRAATDQDADAVGTLLEELGYPSERGAVVARLRRLTQRDRVAVLVAERGGRVEGLVTAHILSVVHRDQDVAQLTALVVSSRARRHGVGRALVEAAEAFARREGCERITVTMHLDRAEAHAFYERLGFVHTGRRYAKALPPAGV